MYKLLRQMTGKMVLVYIIIVALEKNMKENGKMVIKYILF